LPQIVGSANAVVAGWGNLGGGVTQFFMVMCLATPFQNQYGLSQDQAWRVAMAVPGLLYVLGAVALLLLCWDTPHARRLKPSDLGKTKGVTWVDYKEVLIMPNVWIMSIQYGAGFGAELALNNVLPAYFNTYFQLTTANAALATSIMGLMNVFARAVGGILSDFCNAKFGFRGKLWVHFFYYLGAAISLYVFSQIDSSHPQNAMICLAFFGVFICGTCGTAYGIVPFVNSKQVATVSGVVAMGGNLGAVVAQWGFYKTITSSPQLPFQVHALFIFGATALTPLLYWKQHGSMFTSSGCCGVCPAREVTTSKDSADASKDSTAPVALEEKGEVQI